MPRKPRLGLHVRKPLAAARVRLRAKLWRFAHPTLASALHHLFDHSCKEPCRHLSRRERKVIEEWLASWHGW